MRRTRTHLTLLAPALALLCACGTMEPSGGRQAAGNQQQSQQAAQQPAAQPPDGEEPAPQGDDAVQDKDHDPALLSELESPDVTGCHEEGWVYDRRAGACSTTWKLASSYTCDRKGIREAFAPTGFQIDEALVQALGTEADAEDQGDGYVIDQCGEADGRRLVLLVKKDESGRVKVREIETRL